MSEQKSEWEMLSVIRHESDNGTVCGRGYQRAMAHQHAHRKIRAAADALSLQRLWNKAQAPPGPLE
jgi:hypothetical protein